MEDKREKDPSGNNNLVETTRTLERLGEATCPLEEQLKIPNLGQNQEHFWTR